TEFRGKVVLGADVRLLSGSELRVGEKSVLDTVDAHLRRFAKTNGAQIAGDGQPVAVRCIDGGLQFHAADELVRFEGSRAFRSPVVHGAAGVLGAGEAVNLDLSELASDEIWAGDVDLRPEEFSGVDGFLDFQIGVWLIRTGGAYGGDTGSEEEARETERHVVGKVCVVDGRGDVEKVVMHADDAGNGGVP